MRMKTVRAELLNPQDATVLAVAKRGAGLTVLGASAALVQGDAQSESSAKVRVLKAKRPPAFVAARFHSSWREEERVLRYEGPLSWARSSACVHRMAFFRARHPAHKRRGSPSRLREDCWNRG